MTKKNKKFEIEFDADFDEWFAKRKQNNQSAQQEQGSQSQPERKFEIKIDDDFDGWLTNNTQTNVTTIAETVFISYSSLEQRTAEEIKQKLESCRISCWMAPKSIPPGSDYGTEIPKAIKKCKIFLLILSENSQNSKWVPKELDMAIKHDLKVIPFQIDNSAINDRFEFSLINCQRIIAYKRKKEAFKDLKDAILEESKKC